MFKIMVLVRRKPGLSREEFRTKFEESHVPLVDIMSSEKNIAPLVEYRRNYLVEGAPENTMEPDEFGFDAIMEVTYENEEHFRTVHDLPNVDPEFGRMIAEDAELLFAEDGFRYLVVNEVGGPNE